MKIPNPVWSSYKGEMRRGAQTSLEKIAALCLAVMLALGLIGVGSAYFSDSATLTATFSAGEWELGGSAGFWKNWDKHDTYTESEILDFLAAIEASSQWLVPDADEDNDIDIDDMEAILQGAQGGTMEEKFLAHYLATRLNMEAERLNPDGEHDITTVDEDDYLDVDCPTSAALSDIVDAIEDKYAEEPTNKQFKTMKDICEALNKVEI